MCCGNLRIVVCHMSENDEILERFFYMDNEELIEFGAKRNSIYTIDEFVKAFNFDEFNMIECYIRQASVEADNKNTNSVR